MALPPYAELHCHSHFSFLDGASAPDDLVARAVELGLAGLAVTDHQGLYGAVRFSTAAEAAGLHPVIGVEIELLDAAVPDPGGIVVPARRAWRPGRRTPAPVVRSRRGSPDGAPARPRPERARLPGHREVRKEDHRGIGEAQRGPHLVLLARDATGWRSLCRLVSRANLAGTKAVPRFTQALLAEHAEGLVALSGCRHGELARRLRPGTARGRGRWRSGTRRCSGAAARRRAAARPGRARGPAGAGFVLELVAPPPPRRRLARVGDGASRRRARAARWSSRTTSTTPSPRVASCRTCVTAIRHGRSLAELADLRRPDGESYLKGAAELLALPPGDARHRGGGPGPGAGLARGDRDVRRDRRRPAGWSSPSSATASRASRCPKGQTPFSHLSELCWEGARRRYHPLTPAVVKQLAHELDVIEKTGLAEFFLICWDLMRFAKSRRIPAQGRGSAADSIVAYVLGITRVDPIRHELLFERFINEGRTAYPDVDIDFSSERREEVIQYVYGKYGAEHTGMVCNLVTYRARSAVREVGYALGFPRPLVDRVAKALETYDSVMVRRDLEAEGGFAGFFARPGRGRGRAMPRIARGSRRLVAEVAVAGAAALAAERGLTDAMGQLKHERGGRLGSPTPAARSRTGERGSAPAAGRAVGAETCQIRAWIVQSGRSRRFRGRYEPRSQVSPIGRFRGSRAG